MPIADEKKQARFAAYQVPAPTIGGRGRDEKRERKLETGGAAMLGGVLGGLATLATGGGLLVPVTAAVLGGYGTYQIAANARNEKFPDFYDSCTAVERKAMQDEMKADPAILLNLFTHCNEVGKDDPSALGAYLLARGPAYDLPDRNAEGATDREHKALSDVLMRSLDAHIQTLVGDADNAEALAAIRGVRDLYREIGNQKLGDYYCAPLYLKLLTLLESDFNLVTLCDLAWHKDALPNQQSLVRKIYKAQIDHIKTANPAVAQALFAQVVAENTKRSADGQAIDNQLTGVLNKENVAALLAKGVSYASVHAVLGDIGEGEAAEPVVQKELNALLEKVAAEANEDGGYDRNARNADFTHLRRAIAALPEDQAVMKLALTEAVKEQLSVLYARGIGLFNLYWYSPEEVTSSARLLSFIEKNPADDIAQLQIMGFILRYNHERIAAQAEGRARANVPRDPNAETQEIKDTLTQEANERLRVLLENIATAEPKADEHNDSVVKARALLKGFYTPLRLGKEFEKGVKSKVLALAKNGYSYMDVSSLLNLNNPEVYISKNEFFDAALTTCTGEEDFVALRESVKAEKAVFNARVNFHARRLVVEKGVQRDTLLKGDDTVNIAEQIKAEVKAITGKRETRDLTELEERNADFLEMVSYFQSMPETTRVERDAAMASIVASTQALIGKGISLANIKKAAPSKVNSALVEQQIEDSTTLSEAEKKAAKVTLSEELEVSGEYQQQVLLALRPKFKETDFESKLLALPELDQKRVIALASYEAFKKLNAPKPEVDTDPQKAAIKAQNNANKAMLDVTERTMRSQNAIMTSQSKIIKKALGELKVDSALTEVEQLTALLGNNTLAYQLFLDVDLDPLNPVARLRGNLRIGLKKGKAEAGGADSDVFKAADKAVIDIAKEHQEKTLAQRAHMVLRKDRIEVLRAAAVAGENKAAELPPVAVPVTAVAVEYLPTAHEHLMAADAHRNSANSQYTDGAGTVVNLNSSVTSLYAQGFEAKQAAHAAGNGWFSSGDAKLSADEAKKEFKKLNTHTSSWLVSGQLANEVRPYFRHQKELRDLQAEIQSAERKNIAAVGEPAIYVLEYKPNGQGADYVRIDTPEKFKSLLKQWNQKIAKLEPIHGKRNLRLADGVDVLKLRDEHPDTYLELFADSLKAEIATSYEAMVKKDKEQLNNETRWVGSYSNYDKRFAGEVAPAIVAAREARTRVNKDSSLLVKLAATMKAVDDLSREKPASATLYAQLKLMLVTKRGDDSIGYKLLHGHLGGVRDMIDNTIVIHNSHLSELERHLRVLNESRYASYGFASTARKKSRESLVFEINAQKQTIQSMEWLKDYCILPPGPDQTTKFEKLLVTDFKRSQDAKFVSHTDIRPDNAMTVAEAAAKKANDAPLAEVSWGEADNDSEERSTKIKHFIDKTQLAYFSPKYLQNKLRPVTVHVTNAKNTEGGTVSEKMAVRGQKAEQWYNRKASDKEGGFPIGKRNCLGTAVSILLLKIDSIMALNSGSLEEKKGAEYRTELKKLLKIPFKYVNPHDKDFFRSRTNAHDVEQFAIFGIAVSLLAGVELVGTTHTHLIPKAQKLLVKDASGRSELDRIAERNPLLQEEMAKLVRHKNASEFDELAQNVERTAVMPLARMGA